MAKGKHRKKEYTTEKVLDNLNKTAYEAESFFVKHSKLLIGIFAALIIVGIAYFAYLKYYMEPRTDQAFTEMNQADVYFQQDSMTYSLKGNPGVSLGYEQIIEDYSGTDAANIARYKAASASYKLGDYASAVKYMEDFKTDDPILNAQKFGLIGSALVQSDKAEEALKYYVKAAEATDLEAVESIYYTKAGLLAMQLEKNEEALKLFQTLEDKYPGVNNGEASKYIERLKYAIGGNGE